MGRPTALTGRSAEIITKAVGLGLSLADAAALADVSYRTLSRRRRASAAFDMAIKKARAEGKSRLLGRVFRASKKTWTAAAWILERRYPGEFSQQQRQQLVPPPRQKRDAGNPVPWTPAWQKLSPRERQLLEFLRDRMLGQDVGEMPRAELHHWEQNAISAYRKWFEDAGYKIDGPFLAPGPANERTGMQRTPDPTGPKFALPGEVAATAADTTNALSSLTTGAAASPARADDGEPTSIDRVLDRAPGNGAMPLQAELTNDTAGDVLSHQTSVGLDDFAAGTDVDDDE